MVGDGYVAATVSDSERQAMPIPLQHDASTLFIRREAYERARLVRAAIDERLNLTAEEFRVDGDLVVIGPVPDEDAVRALIDALEAHGLAYFDDFFELSGNWPAWLSLVVTGR